MKKIIVFLGLSFLPFMSTFGQFDQNKEFLSSKQLGLTLSSLGGSGIYYLHPINEKDNFKIAGIYIYDNNDSYSDSYFSIGFDYQRDFFEEHMRRVYFTAGASLNNSDSNNTFFESYDYNSKTSFFNFGAGVGADLGDRSKGLVFNLHISYQLTQSLDNSNRTRVGLGGGIGVGFNF